MGVTINKKSTTTELPPLNGQQPKPPRGLNAFYWNQIFALDSVVDENLFWLFICSGRGITLSQSGITTYSLIPQWESQTTRKRSILNLNNFFRHLKVWKVKSLEIHSSLRCQDLVKIHWKPWYSQTLYSVTRYNRIFNIQHKIAGNGSVSITIPSL